MKSINLYGKRKKIFESLYPDERLYIAEISRHTGLSRDEVKHYVKSLEKDGYIRTTKNDSKRYCHIRIQYTMEEPVNKLSLLTRVWRRIRAIKSPY